MFSAMLAGVVVAAHHSHLCGERNIPPAPPLLSRFGHSIASEEYRADMAKYIAFFLVNSLGVSRRVLIRIERGDTLFKHPPSPALKRASFVTHARSQPFLDLC